MVKIRLLRMGKRHAPFYRIVVADATSPRDGKYIESLGWYDPRGKGLQIDLGKAKEWLSKGAMPTEIVAKLMKRKEEVGDERTN